MDEYGIIGGKTVEFIAEKVNEKIDDGEILGDARWVGINHFQRALKANRDNLRRLNKIVVLDGAFIDDKEDLNVRDVARRALNDFLYLEEIVKRDIDGVFLVLYTKSPVLDAMVKSHYQNDRLSKYKGTIHLLTTNGYQASGMARILGTQYTKFDTDNENLVNKPDENEIKRRVAEQAEIYKLIGQREELRSQIDTLNKKMDLVDRQLNNYLIGDRSDDLDVVSELMGEDTSTATSLTDEIESLLSH